MRSYFYMYQDGGIEKLKELRCYRPQSELMHHKATLEEHFRSHPVASIQEAIAVIEELTGIRRNPTQTRKFIKSIGMHRLKVGTIPSKADPNKQEMFKKAELEPRIEEAKAGKRVLFFVDAAHFVFHAYLGILWCFARVFIKVAFWQKTFQRIGSIGHHQARIDHCHQ
jgi:hypothetical protein